MRDTQQKNCSMTEPVYYKHHRFPPKIIAHAVWLYFRLPLILRLVEETWLERGIRRKRERNARTLTICSTDIREAVPYASTTQRQRASPLIKALRRPTNPSPE